MKLGFALYHITRYDIAIIRLRVYTYVCNAELVFLKPLQSLQQASRFGAELYSPHRVDTFFTKLELIHAGTLPTVYF